MTFTLNYQLSSTRIHLSIMTVEFNIKHLFLIIQIKTISKSKRNKSINEKYLICYCNKKHNFHVANLELSGKSNCQCH